MNRDSLAVLPIVHRVAAGIDFLDREFVGWDKGIDLRTLRLSDCEKCILGQLFSHYAYGLEALDLDDDDPIADLGFALYEGETNLYGELTDTWIAAIQARREVTE